jgi:hypothetical protein
MYATRRTTNRPGRKLLPTMDWLTYIPGKSTLLLLFKAARVRLMTNSENVASLPDARIASATEEINRISYDIRDAKAASSSVHAGAALPANKPVDPEVALPVTVAGSAALKRTRSRAPDKAPRIGLVTTEDLSADAGNGVQWTGEYDALAGRREKGAFVSQLVTLGYSPHDFRVTVRRVPSEGPEDTRQRYTVLVAQLRNGLPVRDKRYVGSHGAEWVNEFSRDAATNFPRNVDPIPVSGVPQRQA